jgi:hypothetical protein
VKRGFGVEKMQQLIEDLATTAPRRGEWEGIELDDQIALIVLSAIEATHDPGVEAAEWPAFAYAAAVEIMRLGGAQKVEPKIEGG